MEDQELRRRAISLFEYLKAFTAANQNVISDIDRQLWHKYVSDIPLYEDYVHINYPNEITVEESDSSEKVLISVKKADHYGFEVEPDSSFSKWINFDWKNYNADPSHYSILCNLPGNILSHNQEDINKFPDRLIYFDDSPIRASNYERWLNRRNNWAEEQKKIEEVNKFFFQLYNLYKELQLNSETEELLCGNGQLQCASNKDVNHPVLLKRAGISFDAKNNIVSIYDTDTPSEIYTQMLSSLKSGITGELLVSSEGTKAMSDIVREQNIHPFDMEAEPAFFHDNIHKLNPKSMIVPPEDEVDDSYIKAKREELYLTERPVLLIRKRLNGAVPAIAKIIEDLKKGAMIPASILNLLGDFSKEEPEPEEDLSVVQKLAEIGGEDPQILLPLPANSEQLAIARRIEKDDAVLVQGPPGTGKTHTIANLIGNFLSQGKRVLVTSDTRKALSVLKDKVPLELQDLCVSLIGDNNRDLEKSVTGITDQLSRSSSAKAKKEKDRLYAERNDLINQLASVRERIYQIQYQEFKPFTYDGKDYSLIETAKYVNENRNEYEGIIPGEIKMGVPLPLNMEELKELYASNETVTHEDEIETGSGMPDPALLPDPEHVSQTNDGLYSASTNIKKLSSSIGYEAELKEDCLYLNDGGVSLHLKMPTEEDVDSLEKRLKSYTRIKEPWGQKAIIDGAHGKGYTEAWNKLIAHIQETASISGKYYNEQIEYEVDIKQDTDLNQLRSDIQQYKELLGENGSISKINRVLKRKLIASVEERASVNHSAQLSVEACDAAIHKIELINSRKHTEKYWNSLMAKYGAPRFDQLDPSMPENAAEKYIPAIRMYVNWRDVEYLQLRSSLERAGIDCNEVFSFDLIANDKDTVEKMTTVITQLLPVLIMIQKNCIQYTDFSGRFVAGLDQIKANKTESLLYKQLLESYKKLDVPAYIGKYQEIAAVYHKRRIIERRSTLLNRIEKNAPQWAAEIHSRHRIHGAAEPPAHIFDAWKWKQFNENLKAIHSESLEELQEKSERLSKEYRKATSQAAAISAWYYLLRRIEVDGQLKSSLNSWNLYMQKVGKGTGKKAAYWRREARKEMIKCQNAVPVWIMTMNQVFDNLTPGENQFDVAIIDEASQSNISALAITCYAKKIIVVGDNKQVSPLAVGIDDSKITELMNTYLDEDIPSRKNYTIRTSLYDIATLTCNAIMLHEHFRCVPDIIGYSNMISYDGKIKPLRDQSSSNLLPAMISYNAHGHRTPHKKTNIIEQNTVIALLQMCFSMPEYRNKTFGVISMLGDEQAAEIQSRITSYIDPAVQEQHELLFGNSAQFQGDERDVIILTLVDSNEEDGPARLLTDGIDGANKKRYNVAVSRAKDQIWVIHSFEKTRDLKDGDLRKTLLDYIDSPEMKRQIAGTEQKSESPFEKAVALALTGRGYKLEQQWPVGSYRIDMVAIDHNKKVAIECDGDAYHSGFEKIEQDMERQTTLERLGWQFIRIRGSEYYADPDQAIERLVSELNEKEIYPYSENDDVSENTTSDLEQKVIQGFENILSDIKEDSADQYQKAKEENLESDLASHNAESSKRAQINKQKEDNEKKDGLSENLLHIEKAESSANKTVPQQYKPVGKTGKRSSSPNKHSFEAVLACVRKPGKQCSVLVKDRIFTNSYLTDDDLIAIDLNGFTVTPAKRINPQYADGYVFIHRKDDDLNGQLHKVSMPDHQVKKPQPVERKDNIHAANNDDDEFVAWLKNNGYKFLDKRETGKIIWVFDNNKTNLLQDYCKKHHKKIFFFARGSIATNGRAAWMIMES